MSVHRQNAPAFEHTCAPACIPFIMLHADQRSLRPRRGRPRKNTHLVPDPENLVSTQSSLELRDPAHYDSSVAKHLAANPLCRATYLDTDFSVVTRGRSFSHLQVLEALYIRKLSPPLCAQTKVKTLKLFPLG